MKKIGVRLLIAAAVIFMIMIMAPNSQGMTASAVPTAQATPAEMPKPAEKPSRPEPFALLREDEDWSKTVVQNAEPADEPGPNPTFSFSKKRFVIR